MRKSAGVCYGLTSARHHLCKRNGFGIRMQMSLNLVACARDELYQGQGVCFIVEWDAPPDEA